MENGSKKIAFGAILGLSLIFLIVLFFSVKKPAEFKILEESSITTPVIFPDDPVLGPKNAKITIVEFADFGCPFCKTSADTLKDVLSRYKNEVKLVWKDLPLTTLPTQSKNAHIAALCAHEQNMFWEYHNILFQRQDEWLNNQNFEELSAEIKGLDPEKFKQCLKGLDGKSKKIIENIQNDAALASRIGVDNAPYFFIGGNIRMSGAPSLQAFQREIEKLR